MAEHFITVLMSTVWGVDQAVFVYELGEGGRGEKDWEEGEGNPTFICPYNQLLQSVNGFLDNLWRNFAFITVLKLIREMTQLCSK